MSGAVNFGGSPWFPILTEDEFGDLLFRRIPGCVVVDRLEVAGSVLVEAKSGSGLMTRSYGWPPQGVLRVGGPSGLMMLTPP